MDPIFAILSVFVVILFLSCVCVKKMRMACCWTRLDLSSHDVTIVDILKAVPNESDNKKNEESNSSDRKKIQKRNSTVFNQKVPNRDIELKLRERKGKSYTYLEKKWKTTKDTFLGENLKKAYNEIASKTYLFLIWELAIIIITASMATTLPASIRTGLQNYIIGSRFLDN